MTKMSNDIVADQEIRIKEKIYRTALCAFSVMAYESVSLCDLAEECGLSESTLLMHIHSKERLFITVLKQHESFCQHAFFIPVGRCDVTYERALAFLKKLHAFMSSDLSAGLILRLSQIKAACTPITLIQKRLLFGWQSTFGVLCSPYGVDLCLGSKLLGHFLGALIAFEQTRESVHLSVFENVLKQHL